MLAFVHFQDHHVRVQIEQEVGPLAAAQGGVERDLVVTGGHQAVHVQEVFDDFLFGSSRFSTAASLVLNIDGVQRLLSGHSLHHSLVERGSSRFSTAASLSLSFHLWDEEDTKYH